MKTIELNKFHLTGFPFQVSTALPATKSTRKPRAPMQPFCPTRPEAVGGDGIADAATFRALSRGVVTFERALTLESTAQGCAAKERNLCLGDPLQRHMLIVGSTGSGKTTSAIFPLILSELKAGYSIIIFEAKGDICGPILDMVERVKPDVPVHIISLSEPEISLGYNPVGGIQGLSQAKAIMTQLSLVESTGDESYFRMQAVNLGAAILSKGKVQTMTELAGIINSSPSVLEKTLEGEMTSLVEGLKSASNNAQTVLSQADCYLAPFQDEDVAAVTSNDEFNFDMLAEAPTVVIVRMPEGDARLKAVLSLLVDNLFLWLAAKTKKGGKLEIPIRVYLDEFASALPKLATFPRVLNTSRSRGMTFVAACQSLNQVRSLYGLDADSVLAGFGSYLALPKVSQADATYLSEMSGTIEAIHYSAEDGIIIGKVIVTRPTLLPKEISDGSVHPKYGRCATLLLVGCKPFQLWLRPIWEYKGFSSWKSKCGAFLGKAIPLREAPLTVPEAKTSIVKSATAFTDTTGWTSVQIQGKINKLRPQLLWDSTTDAALKWWIAFEEDNQHQRSVVLRLFEELVARKATATEFFLAFSYANTESISAVLCYLDFTRLKKAGEKNRFRKARESRAKNESASSVVSH